MGDFDWYGTCAAVHASGACSHVMAGDTAGNILSSYPLGADGNYAFWAYSDPYKATVSKADGSEASEDIYECYNLSLLLAGRMNEISEGHGIRINGEKYMYVRPFPKEKLPAKIVDASGVENTYNVTLENVHLLRKGNINALIVAKGGYFFLVKGNDKEDPKQTVPAMLSALAIGFYWAVGPDA